MMEGWKTDKLMNLVSSITTGKLDANAMVPNGQYRFYTCAKEFFQIDKYAFDDEALLISGNGEYVGYIHYYKGKFNAYQRVYVITGFKIDVKYLQNFLNRYLPIRINKEVSQNNIPYIRLSTLSKMDIKYPESKSEQSAIAAMLSKVDEAIAAVQASISAAERLKKSLMQNLLTGRMKPDGTLRKEDEFYVDEKFGKVPLGWVVKKVKECFKFKNGKGNTTSNLKEIPDEKYCVPVFGGNGITGYFHSALLNEPTIVIGRVGEYCGNVFKTPAKSWVTDNAMLVSEVLMKEYDIDFFALKLNSLNFKQFSDSTGQPKITQGSIGSVLFAYPSYVDEQNGIMSLISHISKQIQQKQNKIAVLERLKKSLMQNLLTGRVRVKISK